MKSYCVIICATIKSVVNVELIDIINVVNGGSYSSTMFAHWTAIRNVLLNKWLKHVKKDNCLHFSSTATSSYSTATTYVLSK